MDWKLVVSILIGIVVYLVGLGIFSLIKYISNKRKFKKEKKEHEKQEQDSKD